MDLMDTEVYALIGEEGFTRLIAAFYQRVPHDPILSPMYPADDWPGAERRLRLFLMQRFGGPTHYAQERGHPRLRMRHVPFEINRAGRDRWVKLMGEALEQVKLPKKADAALRRFFEEGATFMINRPE